MINKELKSLIFGLSVSLSTILVGAVDIKLLSNPQAHLVMGGIFKGGVILFFAWVAFHVILLVRDNMKGDERTD